MKAWICSVTWALVFASSWCLAEESDAWVDDLRFSGRKQQHLFLWFGTISGGIPGKSFQINFLDRRGKETYELAKLGEKFADGRFQLKSHSEKQGKNSVGIQTDQSELTVLDLKTNRKFTLTRNHKINWPTYFGEFYLRSSPEDVFFIRECESKDLDGNPRFELLEVTETTAKIKLPSGEIRTLEATPQ